MNEYYINDFAVNCGLGSSRLNLKKNLFNKNFTVYKKRVNLNSSRQTYFIPAFYNGEAFSEAFRHYESQNNQLAKTLMDPLVKSVDTLKNKYGSERIAVITASSTSSIVGFEEEIYRGQGKIMNGNYKVSLQEVGNLNAFVADYFHLGPISYSISTACSSGGKVFAEAKRLLDSELCDAVVCGACDSYSQLTLNGFDSLEATSDELCNPFDIDRKGITIGEGGALFVVSREKKGYVLKGVGESSDAYHISSPDPEGVGAEDAIRKSLSQAELACDDIYYINLHGTATRKNDEAEALLVYRLFGRSVCVSSTKPLTGHTLGAAGAVEVAICLICLSTQEEGVGGPLPAQYNLKNYDYTLPHLNFVEENKDYHGEYIMSNSFAFGGSNVSVIVGKA